MAKFYFSFLMYPVWLTGRYNPMIKSFFIFLRWPFTTVQDYNNSITFIIFLRWPCTTVEDDKNPTAFIIFRRWPCTTVQDDTNPVTFIVFLKWPGWQDVKIQCVTNSEGLLHVFQRGHTVSEAVPAGRRARGEAVCGAHPTAPHLPGPVSGGGG